MQNTWDYVAICILLDIWNNGCKKEWKNKYFFFLSIQNKIYITKPEKKKTKNKSFKNGDSCIKSPKYFR